MASTLRHQLPTDREFTWRDGERVVVFRQGAVRASLEVLHEHGWDRFELLTTSRALLEAPLELADAASTVHEVGPGPVARIAAELIDAVTVPTLVALGGGRVIDAAKAIAAVRGGRVAALPTTLSGAEMTRIHRIPEGHRAPHLVRPALVIADPHEMTSLAEDALRASAMNALAHGAEALYTPLANPVGTMAALRGAMLIATALERATADRDRAGLALGSLLCAYAMDGAGYALHHVVCQTLVQVLGAPHAETNATMLPRTMEAMRGRAPEAIAALADALGTEPDGLPARIDALGGGPRRLADLGADRTRLDEAVDAILAREQLARTPDPPGREELRELIEDAF
jgi:alcohol dehydrogenase class IV